MPLSKETSYLPYVNCAHLIAQVGFFSSAIFCFILIFLTLFGIQRSFGSYKNLLIIFPTVGIVFATMEVLLYPQVHSYNAAYFFYSTCHPFNISTTAVTWWMVIYTGIYAYTISMLAVQFVYRYWAVFDTPKLRYFMGPRFLYCLVYSGWFGVQWAVGNYFLGAIDEYAVSYMKYEMLGKYNIDSGSVAGICFVAYDAMGNVRWRNLVCIFNMTLIMLIQYTVIFYCAYFMCTRMESQLRLVSTSLQKVHKQFFKTLMLQIFTPTVFLFSPVIFIMLLPLFNLEESLPTGMFLCSFTLFPAMDAIIIMYIVTDYRKGARRLLRSLIDKMITWLNTMDDEKPAEATATGSTDAKIQGVLF